MTWRPLAYLSLFFCGLSATAQNTGVDQIKKRYAATPAVSSVKIDGALTEATWEQALQMELPIEWSPGDNTPAPVRTLCYLAYDRDTLYVAFRAYDQDPGKIRARLADRDDAFEDDTVGFTIDTFNDSRRGYQFRVNPLGIQMDAINSDVDNSQDWSWDAIWDAAAKITDEGYQVEIALPLNQLRFPRDRGPQTWGFLAMRDYPRKVRHRLRSTFLDRDRDCFICQLEKVAGFKGLKPGLNLELTPSVTGIRAEKREDWPDGPLELDHEEVELGATLRWGVTPNITVNAAVNPDFSQIEADRAQLDVNNRFALFFPEKRPFFLESADFFNTPLRAVFTRTVVDPESGLRAVGKEGPHAFGFFYARDNVNTLLAPGYQQSTTQAFDEELDSAVFRYRRDVGRGSTLGAMFTNREGSSYYNRVYGVDGAIRLGPSDTIRFQGLRSETRYDAAAVAELEQPQGELDDEAFALNYRHGTRDWRWGLVYEDLGPLFRADSGFINRVDARAARAELARILWGEQGHWFRQLEFSVAGEYAEDQDGERAEDGADLLVSYSGAYQSFLRLALAPNTEYFDGETYDNFRQSVFYRMQATANLFFSSFIRWGEAIDFSNSRQADLEQLQQVFQFNIGRGFRAETRFDRQALRIDAGRIFRAHIAQGRLFYHFNARAYVRAVLQYTDIERNAELYESEVDDETERALNQFLFSYKLNARTVALFGFAENADGDERVDLTTRDRTLFLKLSYAWLF